MLRERTDFIRNILYAVDLAVLSLNFFVVYVILLHHSTFYTLDLVPAADLIPQVGEKGLYLQAYWLTLFLWAVVLKVFYGIAFVQTPLPLLCVFLGATGVMSILMGLLAEMLNRTYHESQAKPVYRVARVVRSAAGDS